MTTLLLWPDEVRPQAVTWRLRTATDAVSSPFTGSGQTWELPGARWECLLTFRALQGARLRALEALLAGLRGPAGRVFVPRFHDWTRRGTAVGAPLRGYGQLEGKTLEIRGITSSGPIAFGAGDLIGVGERTHRVLADTAAAGGVATIKVAPPLRWAVDGSEVYVANPCVRMRLADDDQDAFEYRPGGLASIQVALVEALD